jgi:large subunit ribosomal protein L44e
MKIPKLKKVYCPKCRKHTEHKVTEAKRKGLNATHTLTRGSKFRTKKRGLRGRGNLGKLSRKAVSQRKMTGKKQTKKIDLRYECSVCKKKWSRGEGFRSKKIEFV